MQSAKHYSFILKVHKQFSKYQHTEIFKYFTSSTTFKD